MRRRKLFNIRRIALALAVALIVPATAQAESMPKYELGPGEIPYLSQGEGVNPQDFAGSGPTAEKQVVVPYLSQGIGVTSAELGLGKSPDDRNFSRATDVAATPVVIQEESGIDFGSGVEAGLVLMLGLLAGGAAVGIWHNRRTKLSPA